MSKTTSAILLAAIAILTAFDVIYMFVLGHTVRGQIIFGVVLILISIQLHYDSPGEEDEDYWESYEEEEKQS